MNKLRSQTLYLGFFGSFFSRVIISALQILVTAFVSRFLGENSFGLWMLLSQLLIIVTMLDFGIGGGGLRNELAKLYVENHENQKNLFLSSFYLVLYICLGLALALFFASFWLPKIALFPALFIILRLPFTLYGTGFLAYQSLNKKAWCEAFETFVFFVFVVCLVRFQRSESLFFFLSFFSLLLASGVSFWFFLKTRGWQLTWINFNRCRAFTTSLLKVNFRFWLLNLFSIGLFAICPFLVNHALGLKKAGEFCLFQRIMALILGVHFLAINALWSGFSDAFHRRDFEWMRNYFKKGLIGTLIYFSLFSVVLTAFHHFLIFVWSGKLIQNTALAALFSLASFLYGLVNILSVFLNAQNLIQRQVVFLFFGVLINVSLGILLGKIFGEIGVVVAFILSLCPLFFSDLIEVRSLGIWSNEREKNFNS